MGVRADERVGRFDSLRDPHYRVLFLSGLFVFLATHAQQIARGWLAKELTGTNAGIGGVFLGFGGAMLVASFASGVIADRFPKRNVLMVSQGVIMVGAVFIAVALELGALRYWMLVAASVLHGAGMANMGPVRVSYTAELVDRSRLPNAIVLTQMSVNSTRIIGPSIAGTLIGIKSIGTGGVYVITSLLCLVSIYWTSRLPKSPASGRSAHMSPATAFVEGVAYVRRDRRIGLLVASANAIAIIGLTYIAFLPKMVDSIFHRHAGSYGTMMTFSAIGALTTSFWMAGRVAHGDINRIQTIAGFLFSLGLVALASTTQFWVAVGFIAALGGASSAFQVSNNALVATLVDAQYQGRVQALLMMGFSISSIVALPVGMLADRYGIRETTLFMGAACIAVMIVSVVVYQRIAAATIEPGDGAATASLADLRPTAG